MNIKIPQSEIYNQKEDEQMKGSTKQAETKETKVTYDVTVKDAKEYDWGVTFTLVVNGVTIYGCIYREYTTKEGKEGTMITFPSRKGENGNYYDHAFFPMSKEVKEEIIAQLQKLV